MVDTQRKKIWMLAGTTLICFRLTITHVLLISPSEVTICHSIVVPVPAHCTNLLIYARLKLSLLPSGHM